MRGGTNAWPGASLLLAGFLMLHACARSGPDSSAPANPASTPQVRITNASGQATVVAVEVARTPAQREQGLMFRRELKPDAGMLFIFPDESFQAFWMKNTLISLDLIFINARLEVVGIIARAGPESLDRLEVDRPSRYVLEVGAGFCEKHGLAQGNRVQLIGIEE